MYFFLCVYWGEGYRVKVNFNKEQISKKKKKLWEGGGGGGKMVGRGCSK